MLKNPEKTIGKMIEKAGTCFLSYIDKNGYPVTKAMNAPRERDRLHTLYFSTNTSSDKVSCFRDNPQASVYFMDK